MREYITHRTKAKVVWISFPLTFRHWRRDVSSLEWSSTQPILINLVRVHLCRRRRAFIFGQCDPQDHISQPTAPEDEEGNEKPGAPHPSRYWRVCSKATADTTDDTIRLRFGEILQVGCEGHKRDVGMLNKLPWIRQFTQDSTTSPNGRPAASTFASECGWHR
jgi:hypothetical protein